MTPSKESGWSTFFIVLSAVGAGLVLFKKEPDLHRQPQASPVAKVPKPVIGKPADVYAYIYQKRNDPAFTMAIGTAFAKPREMGIFETLGKAQSVARDHGWRLAWKGSREL